MYLETSVHLSEGFKESKIVIIFQMDSVMEFAKIPTFRVFALYSE